MVEVLRISEISDKNLDATIENEEMKKIQKLLGDQSLGIDVIRYQKREGLICIVPSRDCSYKGYGSFIISKDDFTRLRSAFSSIGFIEINSEIEQSEVYKVIKIDIQKKVAPAKKPRKKSVLISMDKKELTKAGIPEVQVNILQKILNQLALSNVEKGYLGVKDLDAHITALREAIRAAISKYEEVLMRDDK